MGAKQRRSERAAAYENGNTEPGQDLGKGAAALVAKAKVKGRFRGARDKVTGAADDVSGTVQSAVSDTADRVQCAASDTVQDVSRKARKARKKARKAAKRKAANQRLKTGLVVASTTFGGGVAAGVAISRKIASRKSS